MIYGERLLSINEYVDPVEFMAIDLLETSMFDHIATDVAFDESDEEYSYNEAYLMEFTGNEKRNEAYKECLEKLDEVIQLFIKRIKHVQEIFDKMIALFMTINNKNLFKVESQIRQTGRNGNAKLDPINKEISDKSRKTWNQFISLSNKFSVKYSSVTMEEKEKFSKKLDPYFDTLDKIYNKYTNDDYVEKIRKQYKEKVLQAAEYNGKGVKVQNTVLLY